MSESRRRPGDFSFGILNDIRDSKTGKKVGAGTGGLTALRDLARDKYSPKVLQGTGPYRAIVLRIDQKKDGSSKATNPDDASFPAYSVFSPSSTEKDNIPVVALRARIPELDSHLPIPDKYGDEGSGPHQAIINMYTLFIAQDDLVEVPEPGSVIWVDFGGGPFNRTDPVYLGPVLRTQYAGQAGTLAAGAAGGSGPGAATAAFGANCASSINTRAGSAGSGMTGSPLIINSQSPGPRGALTQPARGGGSVVEGQDADPCIVANLRQNLNSGGTPIDAWVGRLSGNGGREVIMFVPGTTDLSKKFELIYWMHGAKSYYTNSHARRLPSEMSNMAKQGRNFVLVHPALPWGGVGSKNRPCRPCKGCMSQQMRSASPKCAQKGLGAIAFSENGQCGDFPKMHSELLTILQNTYKATNLTPFVTIAVHSRGGFSVSSPKNDSTPGPGFARQLTRMPNGGPDRIVLADADYGFKSNQSIWEQYLSKANKKVEFNILVSHSNVKSKSASYPNNSLQAKKLFNALGHEAPDDFRSWFGKHQVPLEKSAGHTIVYIGGERGGPYNSHGDVGYASISYEHSGGTTVKNNGSPNVEPIARDGLPAPSPENSPSPEQEEASKQEEFDCADLQKRLAAAEQGLKVTEERVKKYTKEKQALDNIDSRALGFDSKQEHNKKLEKVRNNLKVAQENLPTIKQAVEKLKKEAETYRFHPNCRKLEKTKPAIVDSPAIVVAPSRQIILPSSGCGGTVTTVGTPGISTPSSVSTFQALPPVEGQPLSVKHALEELRFWNGKLEPRQSCSNTRNCTPPSDPRFAELYERLKQYWLATPLHTGSPRGPRNADQLIENAAAWSAATISFFHRHDPDFRKAAGHAIYMMQGKNNRAKKVKNGYVAYRPEEVANTGLLPGDIVCVPRTKDKSTFENIKPRNHCDVAISRDYVVGGNVGQTVKKARIGHINGAPLQLGRRKDKIIMIIRKIGDAGPPTQPALSQEAAEERSAAQREAIARARERAMDDIS